MSDLFDQERPSGRGERSDLEVRGDALPRFLPGSGADGPQGRESGTQVEVVVEPSGDRRTSRTALRAAARASARAGRRARQPVPDRRPPDGRPPIDPGLEPEPLDPDAARPEGEPHGWPRRVYWRVGHARIDGQRQRVYVPVAPPLATQARYRGPRLDGRRWIRVAISLVVVLGLLIGGFAWGRSWWLHQLDPAGAPGAPVTFEIPPGAGRNEIAQILKDNKIITSEWAFRLYLDRKGIDDLQAGTYTLPERSSAWDIVEALQVPDGKTGALTHKLLIPEGLTLNQIADRVAKLPIPGISGERFLEVAKSGAVRSKFQPALIPTLEGLVFPATYDIGADWTEEQILRRLVDEFDARAQKVGLVPGQPAANGMDPYNVIKIASLIESEAKLDEDRPLISEVIHNRLQARQRLQIDATVLYAREQSGLPRTDQLTLADLALESPWNTYTVDGLPFTPISAPRESSLEAALKPATGDYLYYVLTDTNGKHSFASTFEEFEQLRAQAVRDGVIPS